MRVLSFIPVLVALVTVVTAVALPGECGSGIGCKFAARDMTNAERLRRGLPLKSPFHRRGGTPVRRADPSATPGDPKTISHRGIIQVINEANGNVLGYLSKNSLKKSQIRYQSSADTALIVNFKTDKSGSGTNLGLSMENSDTGFPLLGLVQGLSNKDAVLSPGSCEFAVLAGVAAPGSTPGSTPTKLGSSYSSANEHTRLAESAIWTFAVDGTLTPRWVNPDKSLPAVHSFTQSDGGIYVAADTDAYAAKYKSTPTVITFKFVSL